jgi:hypothetical protein
MKRILSILTICLLFLSSLCACTKNDNWIELPLPKIGSIFLPDEWDYSEIKGRLYITNQEGAPMLIQSNSYPGYEGERDDPTGKVESNQYCQRFQGLKILSNEVFSNGNSIGKSLYSVDGTEHEMSYLEIWNDGRRILFVAWSEEVDESLLKTIANSFVPK